MKKTLKIFLVVLTVIFIIICGVLIYFSILVKDAKLNLDLMINTNRTIEFYDKNGDLIEQFNKDKSVEKIENINDHTINAFISIEDKRFYKHNGVDFKGLMRATLNNVKNLSFKEGASTISQQLIKNTHLSSEKTLKRKLIEIKLALTLEKKMSKDQILETYLNTIYFGNGCYGIKDAAKFYFNKQPGELTLNESAILAATIKAPSVYSPTSNAKKCYERKNLILKEMLDQSLINQNDYNLAKNEQIKLNNQKSSTKYDFFDYAKCELDDLIKNSPYKYKKLKIFTSYSSETQKIIEEKTKDLIKEYEYSAIICDNNFDVLAFTSSCGQPLRQVGSTIKPLLCHAPAIELNLIESCTPLLDEKTDFNGYSPSNYNNKYYGYISAKESLAKSSNVCAVKLLNYIGIDRATRFINQLGIKTTDNDKNLSLALGASENGTKLSNIVNAYGVFQNNGNYKKIASIDKICTENDEIIYKNAKNDIKVFSPETVEIINDMLRETVENGTSKRLSALNFPIYAKTGTVGSNKGNTDAYSVSYTSENLVGIWIGNKSEQLLPNNITGGTLPSSIAYELWSKISKNPQQIKTTSNLYEINLDKESYDKDHELVLADINSPKRYVLTEKIKNPNLILKQSTRFSSPKIEEFKSSYNNNIFELSLCHAKYLNCIVIRELDGRKTEVFNTLYNGDYFIDDTLLPNKVYRYYVVPYYNGDDKIIYGNESLITTIKTPAVEFNDWWKVED